MTRRKPLLWKFLLALLLICAVGSLLAWGILLTAICSTPEAHGLDAQHTTAYSCHGMTVYMSSFEALLRQWLIPVGMLFTMLSVVAGAMVALSTGKVKIKVQVRVEHATPGDPQRRNGE